MVFAPVCDSFTLIVVSSNAIEIVFAACDGNNDGELNEHEVHDANCMNTLSELFGLAESGLDELFAQIDTNSDKQISSVEAMMAYESIDILNRKNNNNCKSWKIRKSDLDDDQEDLVKDSVKDCDDDDYNKKGECVADALNKIEELKNVGPDNQNPATGYTVPRMWGCFVIDCFECKHHAHFDHLDEIKFECTKGKHFGMIVQCFHYTKPWVCWYNYPAPGN